MPLSVVYRDLHFFGITVVHTIGTLKVLLAPIVVRIVSVRIVVEPLPVLITVGRAPVLSECLLGLGCLRTHAKTACDTN